MARNKNYSLRNNDQGLTEQEIELIKERRTETVLRAVMRYIDEDVATAVSKARLFLRDEEVDEVEDVKGLLAQDEISFPSSVSARERDARFGRERQDNTLLSDTDLLSSDFNVHQDMPTALLPRPVSAPAAGSRRIPKKKGTPAPSGESQPRSRREARRQAENQAQPVEERTPRLILPATNQVDDSAYDFLDDELDVQENVEASHKSLLIPDDDDFWDAEDEQQDDQVEVPTKEQAPPAQETYDEYEEDEDEDFSDLWTLPEEDKQTTKKSSSSMSNILDQLGDLSF